MILTQCVFLVLTPTCIFFSLLFVECSKRAIDFESSATLASLQHIRFQGELLFLARTGFFPSRLDVLNFGHGPSLYLFQFLKYSQTQKFEDRCSCGDDFQILGIISIKFQQLFIGYIIEFYVFCIIFCLLWLKCWGLDWLVCSHSRISVGATHGSFWVVTNLVSEHQVRWSHHIRTSLLES